MDEITLTSTELLAAYPWLVAIKPDTTIQAWIEEAKLEFEVCKYGDFTSRIVTLATLHRARLEVENYASMGGALVSIQEAKTINPSINFGNDRNDDDYYKQTIYGQDLLRLADKVLAGQTNFFITGVV